MVKQLIAYQDKEMEMLKVLFSVEEGRVKRELDEAIRQLEATKQLVLALDDDAKQIISHIEVTQKNLEDLFERSQRVMQGQKEDATEDELNSALNYAHGIAGKIAAMESQLVDLGKQINLKASQFEDAWTKLGRMQKIIQTHTPIYQKQKADIAPELAGFEKQLAVLAKELDAKLLERYKKKRSSIKSTTPVPVAVPLKNNRCGGCHFELPLSQIHKISTDNYIICEECGRIIYKS